MMLLTGLLLSNFVAHVDAQGQGNASNVFSYIVANNTLPVAIRSGGGLVTGVDFFNNSASNAYLKLYDSTAVTCGSGTIKARYLIPSSSGSNGAGGLPVYPYGDRYVNGITACVTTGIADGDVGVPAGATYIVNVHWQ